MLSSLFWGCFERALQLLSRGIPIDELKVNSLKESQQLVEGLAGNLFENDISCSIGLAGLKLLKYIHQIKEIYEPILVLCLSQGGRFILALASLEGHVSSTFSLPTGMEHEIWQNNRL